MFIEVLFEKPYSILVIQDLLRSWFFLHFDDHFSWENISSNAVYCFLFIVMVRLLKRLCNANFV